MRRFVDYRYTGVSCEYISPRTPLPAPTPITPSPASHAPHPRSTTSHLGRGRVGGGLGALVGPAADRALGLGERLLLLLLLLLVEHIQVLAQVAARHAHVVRVHPANPDSRAVGCARRERRVGQEGGPGAQGDTPRALDYQLFEGQSTHVVVTSAFPGKYLPEAHCSHAADVFAANCPGAHLRHDVEPLTGPVVSVAPQASQDVASGLRALFPARHSGHIACPVFPCEEPAAGRYRQHHLFHHSILALVESKRISRNNTTYEA